MNGGDTAHCGDAGRQRCAVSRAYYAAFRHARNYARDNYGFSPRYDPRDHEDVRREYANAAGKMKAESKHEEVLKIAWQLNNLRQWRNYCDYKDHFPGLTTMVTMALREAKAVIDSLS